MNVQIGRSYEQKSMTLFIEIIGWIGSVLIVGSYFLNIQGKLDSKIADTFGLIYWGEFVSSSILMLTTPTLPLRSILFG